MNYSGAAIILTTFCQAVSNLTKLSDQWQITSRANVYSKFLIFYIYFHIFYVFTVNFGQFSCSAELCCSSGRLTFDWHMSKSKDFYYLLVWKCPFNPVMFCGLGIAGLVKFLPASVVFGWKTYRHISHTPDSLHMKYRPVCR